MYSVQEGRALVPHACDALHIRLCETMRVQCSRVRLSPHTAKLTWNIGAVRDRMGSVGALSAGHCWIETTFGERCYPEWCYLPVVVLDGCCRALLGCSGVFLERSCGVTRCCLDYS
jgi:hypothetical protein